MARDIRTTVTWYDALPVRTPGPINEFPYLTWYGVIDGYRTFTVCYSAGEFINDPSDCVMMVIL